MALPAKKATQAGTRTSIEGASMLRFDRRAEISELLTLVAQSLRPIYLLEANSEFEELLRTVDQWSSNDCPNRAD